MLKHPFRKAIGLTVLYSIIIIGIFVLQFRNESVIFRNIGQLRLSLAQTQNSEGDLSLKNTIQVNFKGISITADEAHPARLLNKQTSKSEDLTLLSWEQPTPLSVKFNFTNNTSIVFSVTDLSSKATLSITANLPQDASALSLYYKPVSGYSVTEQSRTRQLFSSKNVSYAMSAANIDDTSITFTKTGNVSMFTLYDPSKVFTFASIPSDSIFATESTYNETIKTYKDRIISLTKTALTDAATVPENAIAAYVAELASQGQYTQAIESIPDSFKKGTRRTYFTAPFFNSLISMNASLVMNNENIANMISNAILQNSIDVFSVNGIADYMLRESSSPSVISLAALPGTISDFNPSVSQATGILKVYLALAKKSSPLAESLAPIIDTCLTAIATACKLNGDTLLLTENDVPLSFVQTIETSSALIEYGKFISNPEYCSGGYMLTNTVFAQNPEVDLRFMAEVYPSLVVENKIYPHTELINTENEYPVWAWTCANSISYTENENNTEATIIINFKQGDTHYVILNGIKPFKNIEIYGLSFHTDPRFEKYNSSGYVYNEKTKTLFLKSRHKSTNEKIILTFKNTKPAEEKTIPSAEEKSEVAESNKPVENDTTEVIQENNDSTTDEFSEE